MQDSPVHPPSLRIAASTVALPCAIVLSAILAGCTAEFGLGISEVAVPSQACIPASEAAVAAVANSFDTAKGELVDAYLVRVPAADQGFGSYPAFIFAGRLVSLADEPTVATWALSDGTAFRPIYPLDDAAMLLTTGGQGDPESFSSSRREMILASSSASSARNCAQAGTTPAR